MVRSKSNKTSENASEAFNKAKKNQQDLVLIQKQLETQKCLSSALWQIMKDRMCLSEQDLQAAFEESVAQQKNRVAPACQTCGRSLQESSKACIYCGAVAPNRLPL